MPKVYRALVDVSIPRPVTKLDPDDESSGWVTDGATYAAGTLISEDWLTPRDRKRAEEGELAHAIAPVEDEELPEGYVLEGQFNEPERGIFVAEHEAERTALESYGHIVVPRDQALEALSQNADYEREYQERAKEAGIDRRPVLEHLQQERPRVPDEVLYGAETNTGLPHYRGPVEDHPQNRDDSEGEESGDNAEASRPAPGSQQENQENENRQEADPQTVGPGEGSNPQGGESSTPQAGYR